MKVVLILLLGLTIQACSSFTGFEIGGRVGAYRVDDRQESSSASQKNSQPLMCMFVNCKKELKFDDKNGGYYAK